MELIEVESRVQRNHIFEEREPIEMLVYVEDRRLAKRCAAHFVR